MPSTKINKTILGSNSKTLYPLQGRNPGPLYILEDSCSCSTGLNVGLKSVCITSEAENQISCLMKMRFAAYVPSTVAKSVFASGNLFFEAEFS